MKKISVILILITSFCCSILSGQKLTTFTNYAFIGSSHNTGLTSFFTDYSPRRVATESLTISGLDAYVSTKSSTTDQSFCIRVLSSSTYTRNRKVELSGLAASLLGTQSISPGMANFITNINSVIDNNYIFGSAKLTAAFASLEVSIANNITLTATEKGILLGAISTAKSSEQYWNANYARLKAAWLKSTKPVIAPEKRILKADVAGAVSGGVAGAVIGGTVGTPIGAVPGWVAGAVTGGVSGSVYEAVSQFLDWLW